MRKLDEYEKRVLALLCERPYRSCVALTADLFDTTEDVQEYRVLEWNLVAQILEDLNELGLVRYRLGYQDIPVQIRAERAAYPAINHEWKYITVVGPNRYDYRREPAMHLHDGTDFRNHGDHAVAVGTGETEHEDIITHCLHYPEHREKHSEQLDELFGSHDL